MKIAISGISGGFGKYAAEQWNTSHDIVRVNLRDTIDVILEVVKSCDVFLNHAYSNDTKQSEVFFRVFEEWKDSSKTIINFGTSAIHENGGFSPMYVTNKKHLINLSHTLRENNPYKKVRVINFNPGTLENNKKFDDSFNKLEFKDLFNILNFILSLDNTVEISDITVKRTNQLIKNTI